MKCLSLAVVQGELRSKLQAAHISKLLMFGSVAEVEDEADARNVR
jgi:hypothetical protein